MWAGALDLSPARGWPPGGSPERLDCSASSSALLDAGLLASLYAGVARRTARGARSCPGRPPRRRCGSAASGSSCSRCRCAGWCIEGLALSAAASPASCRRRGGRRRTVRLVRQDVGPVRDHRLHRARAARGRPRGRQRPRPGRGDAARRARRRRDRARACPGRAGVALRRAGRPGSNRLLRAATVAASAPGTTGTTRSSCGGRRDAPAVAGPLCRRGRRAPMAPRLAATSPRRRSPSRSFAAGRGGCGAAAGAELSLPAAAAAGARPRPLPLPVFQLLGAREAPPLDWKLL